MQKIEKKIVSNKAAASKAGNDYTDEEWTANMPGRFLSGYTQQMA